MTSRAGLAAVSMSALVMACGVAIYDISSRALIIEPVERVVFDSDSGAIEVFAFNRTAVNLLFYLTGYESGILDVGHEVADDALRAFILCEGDDPCNADFYAEVPLGMPIEIRADNGGVKLTGVDAAVEAVVGAGDVEGVRLGSPELTLALRTGAVTLAWARAPETVVITVETGDVALTLPAGAYRCDLTAIDGAAETEGITCDPAAAASLKITVQTGDIRIQGAT